ncbi:MAG: glycosyltransferase, partial [Gemmatimonadales bacterium]
VRVYTASYPLPDGAADRPEVHRSPSRPFVLSPEVQWARPDRRHLVADLDRFRPEVVHLATEWSMGYAGLRAARALGVPIIASAHTDYERYARRYRLAAAVQPGWWYLRWFYSHAHRILVPTARYGEDLARRGVQHTAVWSRGVDTGAFSPAFRSAAYREALGIGPEEVIVAYVGRIAPEKGIERLLGAWGRLAERFPAAHLVFTGAGLMAAEIDRRALPRVHRTGSLRGARLAEAYASADIFAMPSETETFGNVTLEAMASGLPVVAVARGGVLDFGIADTNAVLTEPAPGEFAAGLARLLEEPGTRRRLARGARATAARRDWGPVFRSLEDHYRAAAGATAIPTAA